MYAKPRAWCSLRSFLVVGLFLGVAGGSGLVAQVYPLPESLTDTSVWKLSWSDEFSGEALDTSVWNYSEGGNGWGNGELQKYTKLKENVRLENGNLVLEAIKNGGVYTSGRINSRYKMQFTYGRIESRMRIPQTQAIWPALWMLGDTNGKTWPSCGEIDIMESIGKEPFIVHGTVHGPGYSRDKGIGAAYKSSVSLFEEWHLVAVEWDVDEIRWYFDGVLFQTLNKQSLAGKTWVFDHDFYFIINLAVGGTWPDYPDSTSVFPQRFVLDYVRVYKRL